ncbi:MAG: penicillin-binding protein activator, partial [Pseudomonadota bacterium]
MNAEVAIKISARRTATLAAVAAACIALSGCATNLSSFTQKPAANTSLSQNSRDTSPDISQDQQTRARGAKLALILPLQGMSRTALIAKSMKQAAEMALFEHNDPSIQLIVKNDGGTQAGGRAAATTSLTDGAQIILGPLFADTVPAISEVARQNQPPTTVISFSNDRTVAGNGVHLISMLPGPEVTRVVDYAVSRGKRRFAALIPDDAYGHLVEASFRRAIANQGATIIASERYAPQTNKTLEPAQKVLELITQADEAGAPIDALFLPGGPEILPVIGPLIKYAQVDTQKVQLLGTGAWDFPNVGRDPVFVGGWYASPDPRGWRAFSGRFAKTFGQAPPRVATLAY